MRNPPQFKALTLDETKRFSLGAGTRISSVNVKLADIRSRDLPNNTMTKREYATHVATQKAIEVYAEAFGEMPDPDHGDPLQYLTVHTEDAVTCEIWQSGPERRKVKLV